MEGSSIHPLHLDERGTLVATLVSFHASTARTPFQIRVLSKSLHKLVTPFKTFPSAFWLGRVSTIVSQWRQWARLRIVERTKTYVNSWRRRVRTDDTPIIVNL